MIVNPQSELAVSCARCALPWQYNIIGGPKIKMGHVTLTTRF